jgi:hypothetical protein
VPSTEPPPSQPPPPPPEPPQALPLALDLPSEATAPATAAAQAERAPREPGRTRSNAVRALVTLLLLVAAAAGAVAYFLPRWVRQRFIDAAAAHGVVLAIDGAAIDSTGFRLTGLRATSADMPGATATAPELEVETAGLRPTRVTIRGAEITFTGAWSQIGATLSKWRSSVRGADPSLVPDDIVLDGSRLVWRKPVGDIGSIECNDLHLAVTSRGDDTEMHGRSDRVILSLPGGALGPWRVDLDRAMGTSGVTSRVRVALDPGVPEACTLLVVGDETGTTHVDVSVPRSPPARIGLPPAIVGLHGKDVQVEATLHYANLGPSRGELSASGGVHGVEIGSVPRPLDVTWEAVASGDPRQGMDLKHARLAAGPLVGALTGTVTAFDDGARVDLAWNAAPVPCNAFDAPLDESQPFDIGYQLRKLAEATGITKVAGNVSARATAAFDTRDPAGTRLDVEPTVNCQVALFGR